MLYEVITYPVTLAFSDFPVKQVLCFLTTHVIGKRRVIQVLHVIVEERLQIVS